MRVQQENYSSACCIPHITLCGSERLPQLVMLPSWEHLLWLNNNCAQSTLVVSVWAKDLPLQEHQTTQTSTLFSLGNGTSGFLLLCSSSQTSVPGVSEGHAGHLSPGHHGYSLVWQKPQDFQLNSFQFKLINLHNIKIFLSLFYPTI